MKKKTVFITAGAVAAVLVVGGVGVAVADPFDNDRLTGSSLEQASAAAIAEVGEGRVTDSERSDDPDHAYEIEVTTEGGDEVDVDLDESFQVVRVDDDRPVSSANSDSANSDAASPGSEASVSPTPVPTPSPSAGATALDDNAPITDAERASAEQAALVAAGSAGTVTELERSDDLDHAWEVEVTLADGTDVDIELDAAFVVTRTDR